MHLAMYDINDEGNFKWCMGNYSLPLKKDALLKFPAAQPDNWLFFSWVSTVHHLRAEVPIKAPKIALNAELRVVWQAPKQ
jgi:hypothetical protein